MIYSHLHIQIVLPQIQKRILFIRLKDYAKNKNRVSYYSFNTLPDQYTPQANRISPRSRCQILSIRRKYYTTYMKRVSYDGSNVFSACKPPYIYSLILGSKYQILSVRRKDSLQTKEECPIRTLMYLRLITFIHRPLIQKLNSLYSGKMVEFL